MIRAALKLVILVSAVALLLAAPALAEVRTGAFTLSPTVGYQWNDSSLHIDDSVVYGLALGYNASKNWGLELDARYTPTEFDNSGAPDVDVWSVSGNVLYHFMPEQVFVPYLVGGLGVMQYNIHGTSQDDEDFIINFGGGFKYSVAQNVDLRFDLRDTVDFRTDNKGHTDNSFGDDTCHNISATFGLTFQFGGTSNVPVRNER